MVQAHICCGRGRQRRSQQKRASGPPLNRSRLAGYCRRGPRPILFINNETNSLWRRTPIFANRFRKCMRPVVRRIPSSAQQSSRVTPSISNLASRVSVWVRPYSCRSSASTVLAGSAESRISTSAAGETEPCTSCECPLVERSSNVSGRLAEGRRTARATSPFPFDADTRCNNSPNGGVHSWVVRSRPSESTSNPSLVFTIRSAVWLITSNCPSAPQTTNPMPSRSSASKPAARRFLIPERTAKVREIPTLWAVSTRAAGETSKRCRRVTSARVLRLVSKIHLSRLFGNLCRGSNNKTEARNKPEQLCSEKTRSTAPTKAMRSQVQLAS